MRVVRSLQNGVGPLVLLGALVLMGMGSLDAWAPSSSAAPSGAPDVHQTPHLQSDAPASSDLQSRAEHVPVAAEILTSREAENDDADGPPRLSPSATSRSLAPEQVHLLPRPWTLHRRPCVVLCVFLC
jgi:hypothetical protein